MEYIITVVMWTLAIYGFIEVARNIIGIFKNPKSNLENTYLIIAVKNQEENIEGVLRDIILKTFYRNEDSFNSIVVADLGSNDETKNILSKFERDYDYIKVVDWNTCKNILDNI